MREIKFRAWDSTNNKMLVKELETLEFARNGEPALASVDGFSRPLEVTQSQREAQLILIQYTGLHDKNGEEIYEGDIVRFMYNSLPTQTEHIGPVTWNREWALFEFDGLLLERTPRMTIEVIGNIYEHPDLLTRAEAE